MKKLIIVLGILLLSSSLCEAQGRGTPSTLRIKTDANNSIASAGVAQVGSLTTCLFSNCRLAVDASGNLLVVVTGGTFSGVLLGPTQTDCSIVTYSFTGRTTTGLNSHAANTWNLCGGGTLGLSGNTTTVISSLDLLPSTNGTLNLGSASFPWATIRATTEIINGGDYTFSSKGSLRAQSTGVWTLLDAAGSSFGRLQLGGTTSSFPAIKRNAAAINFRLADDSADANITANAATFGSEVTGVGFKNSAAGTFYWSGRSLILSPADGQMSFTNQANTAGIGLTYSSDGKLLFNTRSGGTAATQVSFTQTTPPTCTSANNCGTGNGTFSTGSNDTAGRVTLGTTPASGFIITFNGTWAAAPVCTVWMDKAGMVVGKTVLTSVTSTTTITVVTNGTAPATGDIYAYHCHGIQ